MRIQLYHGTDFAIAQKIKDEGFIVKPNDEHWLGNGIYFYIDKSLAKWWTTNPSKKHGVRIQTPAIIEVALKIEKERVLDLRKKSDFEKLLIWETEYRDNVLAYSKDSKISAYKYRCGLFDDIFTRRQIDVIIGGFESIEQPYIQEKMRVLLKKLKIAYTELQVCVKFEKQNDILIITGINQAIENTEE